MKKVRIFIPIVILMVIINFLNPGIVASSLYCENDNPSMSGVFNFMKTIPLTKEKFALVDDEDFEWLSQFSWHARFDRNTIYAGGVTRRPNRRYMLMHREIMKVSDPLILIDHIDQNGLNNQKYNLRVATIGQNSTNRRKRPGSASQYIGVVKSGIKWVAQIKNNYNTIYLGTFAKEEDAAIAYNNAAIKYHGEFATINPIAKTAISNYKK